MARLPEGKRAMLHVGFELHQVADLEEDGLRHLEVRDALERRQEGGLAERVLCLDVLVDVEEFVLEGRIPLRDDHMGLDRLAADPPRVGVHPARVRYRAEDSLLDVVERAPLGAQDVLEVDLAEEVLLTVDADAVAAAGRPPQLDHHVVDLVRPVVVLEEHRVRVGVLHHLNAEVLAVCPVEDHVLDRGAIDPDEPDAPAAGEVEDDRLIHHGHLPLLVIVLLHVTLTFSSRSFRRNDDRYQNGQRASGILNP